MEKEPGGAAAPRKDRPSSLTCPLPQGTASPAGVWWSSAKSSSPLAMGKEEAPYEMESRIEGHQVVGETAGASEQGKATVWNSQQRSHGFGGDGGHRDWLMGNGAAKAQRLKELQEERGALKGSEFSITLRED